MTNVDKRTLLLTIAFAAGCAHAPASEPSPSPSDTAAPRAGAATPVPVHVVGEGSGTTPAVLTYTKGNRTIYVVRSLAFTADTETSSGTATLDQPHITFYDHHGSPTIADAPHATVQERDHTIVMTGGVTTQTADGGKMTCDVLRYDGSAELLHGRGHVVLRTGNGLALSGDRIDGDVHLGRVRITR
jgi:hypothetical protein